MHTVAKHMAELPDSVGCDAIEREDHTTGSRSRSGPVEAAGAGT